MNQKGAAPVLILIAIIGVVAFLAVSSSAPFKDNLLSSLFPKDSSFAVSPFNPGDTDGDLDVDLFDYNTLLTNFGKVFNDADFNGNNIVDIFDYNDVVSNFNKRYASSPSPSAMPSGMGADSMAMMTWGPGTKNPPGPGDKCDDGTDITDAHKKYYVTAYDGKNYPT